MTDVGPSSRSLYTKQLRLPNSSDFRLPPSQHPHVADGGVDAQTKQAGFYRTFLGKNDSPAFSYPPSRRRATSREGSKTPRRTGARSGAIEPLGNHIVRPWVVRFVFRTVCSCSVAPVCLTDYFLENSPWATLLAPPSPKYKIHARACGSVWYRYIAARVINIQGLQMQWRTM